MNVRRLPSAPAMLLATGLVWLAMLSPSSLRGQVDDEFGAGVRTTPHLTPDRERAALRVPPGFVVQLVASEPDLIKPLNMAFDNRGRLWVTVTQEYPHAAPSDRAGRDALKIIELGSDGTARRITTFADDLNIPIGVYPYRNGAVVFSIPNVWWLEDTDGDGKADRRERLFGPMGFERDTHGLNNAFRRGFDGWLYACHGFNNETRVRGRDGHEVQMRSGNTYRMRLDGQRVEHFTWGQVNPFGMTQDERGDLFTADCHSKPIYQLLRGGYYPSFGAPHDGLGFVPPMMDHLHGSTAIAGVACYQAQQFPAEYRDDLYSGNVMTSRVNRNRRVLHGSTIKCQEAEDFVVSEDPWFRPVDLLVGPDGALYVADFYNRIIGHYEVPLEHPGRDRLSGRIWRISYQGDAASPPPFEAANYAEASLEELILALSEPNLTRRQLALDELSDRPGLRPEAALLNQVSSSTTALTRLGAMWALHRLGALTDDALEGMLRDEDQPARVHALKCLSERTAWTDNQREMALVALSDGDAFARRAASDALAEHPVVEAVESLLDCLAATDARDALLEHGLRIAIKKHWLAGAMPEATLLRRLPQSKKDALASIALAVPASSAANYLIAYAEDGGGAAPMADLFRHAARHADPGRLVELPPLIESHLADQLDAQLALCQSVLQGAGRRAPPAVKAWSATLASRLLESVEPNDWAWGTWPLHQRESENCWTYQQRRCEDQQTVELISSHPLGEQLTGKLVSPTFALPSELSFYLAGHRGWPASPAHDRNRVQLIDAQTQQVLRIAFPPRHDEAQQVVWRFDKDLAGRSARLEVIDDDANGAYAWLAVGRFKPASALAAPALAPATASHRLGSAAQLAVEAGGVHRVAEQLGQLARGARDARVAHAATRILLSQRSPPDAVRLALASMLEQPALPPSVRDALPGGLLDHDGAIDDLLESVAKSAPENLQRELARELSRTAAGTQALLKETMAGRISPRVLQDPEIADRIANSGDAELKARVADLTGGLPSEDEATRQMIERRMIEFRLQEGSAERGLAIYRKQCVACHKIGQEGAVVGPQLDGIGKRGLARIVEDLLDPNRNVDVAFRSTMLELNDGRVVSGLFRRDEAGQMVLANEKGEEFRIDSEEIADRRLSLLSLMPSNVVAEMSEQDFRDLVTFLLAQ